jgi:phospholipid transport system substrate-binding protein
MGKSLAALLIFAAATTSATSPKDVVQRAVTRVIALMDVGGQASPGERDGLAGALASVKRRAQIRAIADELFDFEEITRRALSVHWAARTPEERTEFVGLFTDLLERAYLTKIESYAGERIVYPAEKIDGDFAVVRSRIIPKRRADGRTRDTSLEYRLRHRDGRWKVYDVLIDGVSFVSTYRSQFDRIIKGSSYQTLVDRLRGPEGGKASPSERP